MEAALLVAVAAAFAAGLTLYSGFGLGTLLLPVFALFFPVEVAVAATAVVHGANNVLKVSLVGRHADVGMVLRFGLPAIVAAVAGAALLGVMTVMEPLLEWRFGDRQATVTPVKLVVGILMLTFALFELLPRFRELRFSRRHLVLGGLLSGFFGGLSGHQGALRAAFLAKAGLDTPSFVGTSAVIGLLVDLTRLAAYATLLVAAGSAVGFPPGVWSLVAVGCAAAFVGLLVGKRYLHKVTIGTIQTVTGTLLLAIGTMLAFGLI